jgi:hypothetical protein
MKKSYKLFFMGMVLSANLYAQEAFFEQVPFRGAFGSSDWSKPWANWTPVATKYPGDAGYVAPAGLPTNPSKVSISGKLDPGAGNTINWTNDKYYELSGLIELMSGTLVIQEGTVIRGKAGLAAADKGTLLITKDAKIIAKGTAEKPIIFTSGEAPVAIGETPARNRGDWGGLLMIGKAKLNIPAGTRQYEALPGLATAVYGGSDDTHSSGELQYVRIEFAGNNPSGTNNAEINGLTMAGCGSGTKADYIQVSYSQDDSFEWFGGTTSHKYLIAFAGTDDDFDADEGYRGKVQFALSVKHPAVFELAGTAATNGMELDNNTGLGTANQVIPGINNPNPVTNITFSNVTMVGPIPCGSTSSALNELARTRFGAGVLIRTNNSSSLLNSIVTGYATLLNLNNPNATIVPSVQTKANADSVTVRNSIFACGTSATTSRFASANVPSSLSGWGIRSWIINGPASGITGATNNDTSATTVPFKAVYAGPANGAIKDINFAGVDYSLADGAAYLTGASFEHPKLKQFLITANDESMAFNMNTILSPNPASNQVNINTFVAQSGNVNINIVDMKGNVVSEIYNEYANAGNLILTVNVSELNKGIYMIKAISGSSIKTQKLAIQ